MKPIYGFDSYVLYEIKKRNVYSVRIRVDLNFWKSWTRKGFPIQQVRWKTESFRKSCCRKVLFAFM